MANKIINSVILPVYSLYHAYNYIHYTLEEIYYFCSTDLLLWFFIIYMILNLGIGYIFYISEIDL